MIKGVLFDLDGTILRLDYDEFAKEYVTSLFNYINKYYPLNITLKEFFHYLLQAQKDLSTDERDIDCYRKFFLNFQKYVNFDLDKMIDVVTKYYDSDEYDSLKELCQGNQNVLKAIDILFKEGITLVIATNPVFPTNGIYKRLIWAGIDLSKIKFVTYGENCRYIKPSLKYYQEIISTLGIENESLMMVGNDVEEDMVAAKLNLKTYLIKDNLISRFHNEASFINQGSSEEFLEFIKRREYDNL